MIKKKNQNKPTNKKKASGKVCLVTPFNFHPGNSASAKNYLRCGDKTDLRSQTAAHGLDLFRLSS